MALVWIVLVVVLALMVWDDIPRWWAATLHHGTALWQGLTTHGAIAAGIGALVGGGAGAVVCGFIGWATGRALARGELQRTQQALTQAQRDAADDRQSRRHFEQQAITARQEQARAQRPGSARAVRQGGTAGRQPRSAVARPAPPEPCVESAVVRPGDRRYHDVHRARGAPRLIPQTWTTDRAVNIQTPGGLSAK